ncbi:hypothetical protein [Pannonibacter sp.]|uniref:hypothetical protein n=1 Tax=Pannonibacter sp. TaxID=1906786 RepID=UPI003F6E5C69
MEWLADLATVAATILAAFGLICSARSGMLQARSNDLNSLLQVTNQLREAEARLLECESNSIKYSAEFVNYLNLLETFATAVNGKLFGKATLKIARSRLVNDIAILMADAGSRAEIEKAVTSSSTFRELVQFEKKHRRQVELVKKCIQDLTDSNAELV